MATIPEAMTVALQYQQAGHLREAEQIYRQIVQVDPSHAEVQRLLDAVIRQQGQSDPVQRPVSLSDSHATFHVQGLPDRPSTPPPVAQAVGLNNQEIASQPSPKVQMDAVAYNRQGIALFQQGRLDESLAHFQQALRVWPEFADAHTNLGNIFFYQGRHDQAVACYQQAIRLRPDDAGVRNNLGNVLCHLGRHVEAVAECQHALRLAPDDAGVCNNLGNAFKGKGDLDQAVAIYQQAVYLKPDYAEAHNNLGLTLMEQGKTEEAMACYRQALRLKPDYAEVHLSLGAALETQGRLNDAVACYQDALRLKPDYKEAYFALGVMLAAQGKPHDAVSCYDRTLQLQPDFADAHWARGLALLSLGNFEQGLPEYEWRRKSKKIPVPVPFPQPLWDGSPLAGRTILLHQEGGFGDTLQFIRYAPLVKKCGGEKGVRHLLPERPGGCFAQKVPDPFFAAGGRVIVACHKSLLPLLARCAGIDTLAAVGSALPAFDVYAMFLSLPSLLRTNLATIPAEIPYVFADEKLVERWRQKLASVPGFKIGIAWQGDPMTGIDRFRSVRLTQFAPLARLDGVKLISLQKGPGSEQLPEVGDQLGVVDLGSHLDETSGAFMDSAAVMHSLDLVIACNSAVAHLAGALGVPVWLFLESPPEWRWLLDREDSPWYPTMRMFRQQQRGAWDDVFERMAQEVGKMKNEKGRMKK